MKNNLVSVQTSKFVNISSGCLLFCLLAVLLSLSANAVAEQIEEEALARTILDKLNLIGDDKGGLYLFDRDVESISVQSSAAQK